MRTLTGHRNAVESRSLVEAEAIAKFTEPWNLVVDLGCGSGEILVAAVEAGRLAIGVERCARLAAKAREAVLKATANGAPGFAAVVVAEPADAALLVGGDTFGKVSLVILDMARVGVLGRHARTGAADSRERFANALNSCRMLLRPGGHVLVSMPDRALLSAIDAELSSIRSFDIVDAGDALASATDDGGVVFVLRYTDAPM